MVRQRSAGAERFASSVHLALLRVTMPDMKSLLASSLAICLLALGARADASFINYAAKEINVKVVYYGSATAGLHDNLAYVYAKTNPDAKGKMIALRTEDSQADADKTEFFDFLPLALGEIRGFKTRFHLYTVPGNPKYNASRLLILKGVDGIVFVADGDPKQLKATLESWASLKKNLASHGYDWQKMPLVVQLNHRDLPNAIPVDDLKKALGLTTQPAYEAVATTGVGVFDTLKAIAKLVLVELKRGADTK